MERFAHKISVVIPVLMFLCTSTLAFARERGGGGGGAPSVVVHQGLTAMQLVGILVIFAAVILGGVYLIINKRL